MGEVWRAEDTKLGREVAVKVLPERFTADPERLARFDREARVLAAFSHPGIAQIYEVGAADGRTFLVLELAPGETLADRIARGPIPLEQALPLALQIAEALEAAHERGIVHRDLKPANVKVDAEGRVKVLDFGLARALEPEPGSDAAASLADSPTMTLGATVAGMLMGTAAYMSPEQAAGRPADRRSDIWAFGVVLMEMLVGRQLFEGESVSHVLAGVLKDDAPWGELPADLPPRVRRLLERCLRKKPRERLQAIGDARVVLQEVLSGVEEEGREATPAAPDAGPGRTWLPWTVAAAATLLAAVLLWRLVSAPAAEPDHGPLRFEIAAPPGRTLSTNHQFGILALSPDGRRQAFMTTGDGQEPRLALRDLEDLGSRTLPGSEEASTPVFSPDGEWVAFFARGKLWRIPVAGGPPSPIVDAPGQNRGATWSADGYIYAAPDSGVPLQRVLATGGLFEPVTALDAERSERTHRWPQVLPDGSAVLFTSDTVETTEYYDDARIEAVRPATGERKVLVEQSSRAWFLPPDRLLFSRGGAIFAVPFDAAALEVTGKPVVVLQNVATTVASGAVHLEVSNNGTLLYLAGDSGGADSNIIWVDREGNEEAVDSIAAGGLDQLVLSPDGTRAVLSRTDAGTQSLWVADLVRGAVSRLTFETGSVDPVWSPDGQWIAYSARGGLYRKRADGSGDPELLLPSESPVFPCDFTPDGTRIIVEGGGQAPAARATAGGQADLGVVTLGGDPEFVPFATSPAHEWMADLSPDGRWLAYASTESGRPEIFVRPFPTGGGRWQISVNSGFEPRWSPAGDELFYRDGVGTLFRVPVETGGRFVPGSPEPLFTGVRSGDIALTYSVSPDGSRFLTFGLHVSDEIDRLALVLDWTPEVRRLTAPR
ncbi:MAG: protein kinase [Thermoanaerobaculia bacterium]